MSMASMQGTFVAGMGLVSTPRWYRPAMPDCHFSPASHHKPPDHPPLSASRSPFFTSAQFSQLKIEEYAEVSRSRPNGNHALDFNDSVSTGLPQRFFTYHAVVSHPTCHTGICRSNTYSNLLPDSVPGRANDSHCLKQFSRRTGDISGAVSSTEMFVAIRFNKSHLKFSRMCAYPNVELADFRSSIRKYAYAPRVGRNPTTMLNPNSSAVQNWKDQGQQHQVSNPHAVHLMQMGVSPAASGTTSSSWIVSNRQASRIVRVAYQARSKQNNVSNVLSLPQFSQRDGKLNMVRENTYPAFPDRSSDLRLPSPPAVSVDSSSGEAWVRAAEKLGFGPRKAFSSSSIGTPARNSGEALCEVNTSKVLASSRNSVGVESKPVNGLLITDPDSLELAAQEHGKNVSRNCINNTWNKGAGEVLLGHDEEHGNKFRRSQVGKPKNKEAGQSFLEHKEKQMYETIDTAVHHTEEGLFESTESAGLLDTRLNTAESSSGECEAQPEVTYNKFVKVIDTVEKAKAVVGQLMGKYKHLVHACDTEVADIDVKKESPVGHGRITCFSIYCGRTGNFGDGKNTLWVDVLDGGEEVLATFKSYFEDPSIKKVWHNYSFDKHILSRHGIHAQGFYADTMHLARLWDSARRGTQGGYSLEALTSDKKVMNGHAAHLRDEDEETIPGKTSMKDLFGKANIKKDGTEGKLKVVPPVEELQRGEEWRERWIHYSAHDAVCTWRLWQSLQEKLKRTPWKVVALGQKGSMYDFYDKYWRPFGKLLVQMETDGMFVDCTHLANIEKVARIQQKISESRFRKWAAKYCPDAVHMNVGSDAQIRQILFGGTANRKDAELELPMERVFSVPNTDGFIEEGKKAPKKTRPIVLRGLRSMGVDIPIDAYTSAGWPAVGGAAMKVLAGKVAIDYTSLEADPEENVSKDVSNGDGVLTSAGIKGSRDEDLSVYGKAFAAFGGGQTGKEACMALAALCEVASINTLISNFIEPLQGGDIKSAADGRVHCSLNINTETGRLSARRPSLQNQPALEKDRYKIRQAFVAAPGKSLVVADYGQLELRILAHLANCRSMKEAFKAGGDFHSRTAMNMYSHVREAVEKGRCLLEWEGLDKPPVPLLKDMFGGERRKAKMLNFSIAYGKTAMGLSRDWKVDLEEAKGTVNLWYSDRPEVLAWQEERRREAHQTMRVHTLLGRTRHLPDINSSNSLLRSHMERAAINTPVQGSAADVAMCAMLEINRNEALQELGWKLLLQVHDEVILEGPTESAEVAKGLVVQAMMHPFDGENFLDVELAVDGDHNLNWYAAK